jgi:hypothetical protein
VELSISGGGTAMGAERDLAAARLDTTLRIESTRRLQQAQGNAYVLRLLASEAPGLQRQPRAQPSAAVPGLPREVVTRIEAALETNRQSALDTLGAALVTRGDLDLSFLIGSTMNYVDDRSRMAPGHYGHTSLGPGTGRPRPCRLDIGPDAFRSVGDLYTTVLHEWKHVLQFRRPETASEAADEIEARIWEVENMGLTGMEGNYEFLRNIRSGIVSWERRLESDAEKAAFAPRIAAAQQAIDDAVQRIQTGRPRGGT